MAAASASPFLAPPMPGGGAFGNTISGPDSDSLSDLEDGVSTPAEPTKVFVFGASGPPQQAAASNSQSRAKRASKDRRVHKAECLPQQPVPPTVGAPGLDSAASQASPESTTPPLFQFGGSSGSLSNPCKAGAGSSIFGTAPCGSANAGFGGEPGPQNLFCFGLGGGSSKAPNASADAAKPVIDFAAAPAMSQQQHQAGLRSQSFSYTATETESAPSGEGKPLMKEARERFLEAAMKQARSHADQKQYAEALQACVPVLDAPQELLDLLKQCVVSWQQQERKLVFGNENEKSSLMTQLMDARARVEQLRHLRDQKELELSRERRLRTEAEKVVANLHRRIQSQEELFHENNRLRQQLARAESKIRSPLSHEDVVRELAKLECRPLQDCRSGDRAALKKKLLLKWHPDKQPSTSHACLATQVMQELQNRSEWSW